MQNSKFILIFVILLNNILMRNKILLSYLDLKYISLPSLELSILKRDLSINGFDAHINYLNLRLIELQNEFLWNCNYSDRKEEDDDYNMLFLNYLAIKRADEQLYKKVKIRLMSIKPQKIVSGHHLFDSHMIYFAHELDSLLENIVSEICSPDILYHKFSADKNQKAIACIVAYKIKQNNKDSIIVIDGCKSKASARTLLKEYPQFDYAIYGNSTCPLIALSKEISSKKINYKNLINTISKNNFEVSETSKDNNVFFDGVPQYSDYFVQKEHVNSLKNIGVSIPIQINENNFDTNYIISQIEEAINKYNTFDFNLSGRPLVSVVMPVYNVENYIEESMYSILSQTYANLEFIIINDGSTDNTAGIIKSIQDNRITFIDQSKNKGNYVRRNEGCKLAKGKYICVMDGDDVAMPNRIEKQVEIMENDPLRLAHGSAFILSNGHTCHKPCDYERMKIMLLSNNYFLHPSLIVRKDVLVSVGYYNEKYRYASDYDLVCKIALKGKISNTLDILMQYRVHQKQISSAHFKQQTEYANQIRLDYLDKCGFILSEEEKNIFTLMMTQSEKIKDQNIDIYPVINCLKEQNRKLKYFNVDIFDSFLGDINQQIG